MCGIFYLKCRQSSKYLSKNIINKIHSIHRDRGPDASNQVIGEDWMMVHSRLAITSPSHGNQPIINRKKNAYMIFNGEIYNYKKLAEELKSNKLRRDDYSDTDVLFNCIQEYGFITAIKKLRGMFSIIYYDISEQKVFIARDHFGQKPLWMYQNKEIIAASSTISSLVQVFNPSINKEKLMHSISKQGKACSSHSIYDGIWGLKAGHLSIINHDYTLTDNIFFSFEDLVKPDIYNHKNVNQLEKLNDVAKETVELHSNTNSSLGVLLSGGYDSSMILWYSYQYKIPDLCLTKITPGIEEIPLSVIPKIQKLYPSNMLFSVINPQTYFIGLFDFIKKNLVIPMWGGTSAMSLIAKSGRLNNIKVLLGGDGIDEAMCGYNTHYDHLEENSSNQIHSSLLGEILLEKFNLEDKENLINQRKNMQEVLKNHMSAKEAFSQSILFQDTFEFLQRCNLPSGDLFSMNESVELRNPFVDIKFLEYILNLPMKYKFNQSLKGKYIFKMLAQKKLGNIFHKEKEGTRNYSRLFSQLSNWNLNEFEIMDLLPELVYIKNFSTATRFSIICSEFLIRLIHKPETNISDIYNLLSNKGKNIFAILPR